MRNTVILSVLLFLLGIAPVLGNQAFATEQGVPVLAQNEYNHENEGGEQDTYSENEGEYDQEQPDQYQENEGEYDQEQPDQYQENEGEYDQEQPDQYQENEGEYDQEQPDQYQENEGEYDQEQPDQYQENDGLIDQEQLEKDEPGSRQDLDGEPQGDLPAPSDLMPDAALSGGSLASPLVSGQCDKAAGKVLFLLDNVGIHPGTTYIKSQGMAAFSNSGPVTHPVAISPSGFFDSNSFRVIPGTKVYTKASSTTQSRHGRIIVNQGKSNETVHDVVICP